MITDIITTVLTINQKRNDNQWNIKRDPKYKHLHNDLSLNR